MNSISMVDFKVLSRRFMGGVNLGLGRYDSLKRIQAREIERFVFVCRGNVCRSPYAEVAAEALGLSATSCGVNVEYSAPAEELAIRAALLRGKDLSKHMSRSIFAVPLDSSDCLVAMDSSHLPVARDVAVQVGCQVTLISLWLVPLEAGIPDPYGKPLQFFCHCFDAIDEALGALRYFVENKAED